MSKIQVLEKNTRDQIAAGEVAERPGLIIKELIENAIDAGATDIRVSLKESGIEEIRVIDNGSGMEKDDIPLAFLRHATSKLRTIEDLNSLQTMGFRGEALASIAAVSKIRVRTKTDDAPEALECTVEDGVFSEILPAPGNRGTEITVSELFYNVPARKKFLATPVREMREISDIVGRIVIAYPRIRFELSNNGKKVFLSPGNGDMIAAIAAVYGTEPIKFLLPLEENEIFLGFIAHPNYSKPNRNYFHFYINHRFVQSNELNKALENAYKTLLPERRFPVAFINVTLSPDRYDINVHPNKLDVKFDREIKIEEQLLQAVKETLENAERSYTTEIHEPRSEVKEEPLIKEQPYVFHTPIHQELRLAGLPGAAERKRRHMEMGDDEEAIRREMQNLDRGRRREFSADTSSEERKPKAKEFASVDVVKNLFERGTLGESNESLQDSAGMESYFADVMSSAGIPMGEKGIGSLFAEEKCSEEPLSPETQSIDFEEGFYTSLDILGQVGGSFIVAAAPDALYLIDQHAAHERLLFNKIKADSEKKDVISQPLLIPQQMELSYRQFNWMVENILVLRQMGFVLEEFGTNCFVLREVPVWAENADAEGFLKEFADGWLDTGKKLTMETVLERKIMSKACKRAVKANWHLTKADMLYLMQELDRAEDAFTCPHGRPISVKITIAEIRRKFLRT